MDYYESLRQTDIEVEEMNRIARAGKERKERTVFDHIIDVAVIVFICKYIFF